MTRHYGTIDQLSPDQQIDQVIACALAAVMFEVMDEGELLSAVRTAQTAATKALVAEMRAEGKVMGRSVERCAIAARAFWQP
jgi:hypothetical protein